MRRRDLRESAGPGDEWYFQVGDGTSGWNLADLAPVSLVETADPDGLAVRERMLTDGWRCPTCGQEMRADLAAVLDGAVGQ